MKWPSCLYLLLVLLNACGHHNMLAEIHKLDHYPSASGMEMLNGKIYLIGDDATQLLVLDSSLHPVDSVKLFSSTVPRIPKKEKADLESIVLTEDNQLLLVGSGSGTPYRNAGLLFNTASRQLDSIRLDRFYSRLSLYNIRELNIEGACAIPGSILLANRGSKGYPKNQLIITRPQFWTDQDNVSITTLFLGQRGSPDQFSGVSGLCYSKLSDRLIATVSTEDTRNTMDDGVIGKSYLWIFNTISAKRRWSAINPDQVIDLEAMDYRFKQQKIESVCILREDSRFLHLLLAADNDDGSSTLFRVTIEKK